MYRLREGLYCVRPAGRTYVTGWTNWDGGDGQMGIPIKYESNGIRTDRARVVVCCDASACSCCGAPPKSVRHKLWVSLIFSAETNNLVAQHPEQVAQRQKKATDIVVNGRTTEGPVQRNGTGYWKGLDWITEAEYDASQRQ